MEVINIALFVCILFSFENAVVSRYEPIRVHYIVEVAHKENISDFDEYPPMDTDEPTEAERKSMCEKGIELVRNEMNEENYVELLQNSDIEKLKLYALLRNVVSPVEVVSGYKCPTKPFIYIHVKYEADHEPVHWVIFKTFRPLPISMKFTTYYMKLAKEITGAHATEITSASPNNIKMSDYDMDAFSEEVRLQMCRKAAQIVPEMEIQFLENTTTGTNKLYGVLAGLEGPAANPKLKRLFVPAFVCPTRPLTYVHVDNELENQQFLLAFANENEIEIRPPFNISAYMVLYATLVDVYKGPQEGSSKRKSIEKKYRFASSRRNAEKQTDENSPTEPLIIDELLEEECRNICAKVIKMLTGEEAELTNGTIKSQYYAVKLRDTSIHFNVLKTFMCPSRPLVYIFISNEGYENMVYVIVDEEEDFERLTSEMKIL